MRTFGLVAHVVAEVGAVEGLLVDEGVVHLWAVVVVVVDRNEGWE
jgi:hypothetical protein